MQLTVKRKLTLSFSIIMIVMAFLGIFSYSATKEMNQNTKELNDVWLSGVNLAHTINSLGYEYRTKEYRYVASVSVSAEQEELSEVDNDMKSISESAAKAIEAYRDAAISEENIKYVESLKAIWERYLETSGKAIALMSERKIVEAMELLLEGESKQAFDNFNKATIDLVKYNHDNGAKTNNESKAIYKGTVNTLIVIIASALILSVLMAYYIVVNITKSISALLKISKQVAAGNLTEKVIVKSKDELGQLSYAFNMMIERMFNIISKISENSYQVASSAEELTASSEQSSKATEQIASSSQTIALGAEKQLESVKEASDSVLQVSKDINAIALSSQEMSQLAIKATNASVDGMDTVSTIVRQMDEINATVHGTAKIIKSLGSRSQEIDKIVEIITDITNQTNLLSLNAAIEAARAGEAGRGFAVVAEEIRKLAEQSKASAQQIKGLVNDIRRETDSAVLSISNGAEKVEDGLTKSVEVSNVFKLIHDAVSDVNLKIQGITASTTRISTESHQIVQSIEVVEKAAEQGNNASQENAAASQEQLANMEEIAASAQALSKSAEELSLIVSQFKIKKD